MKKVLLVDDEPYILKGLALVVDSWGFHPLAARDGEEALRLVEANGIPAALLTDYRLRDRENGMDVIAAVRRRCGTPVPAILLTGDTEPARLRHMAHGEVPILHKPAPPDRIRLLLTMLTDDARARQCDPGNLRARLIERRAFARR